MCQAPRQHFCRCACQISKRYDNLKYQSRGFETSRDLTKRRLFGYWDGAQVLPVSQRNYRDIWCQYGIKHYHEDMSRLYSLFGGTALAHLEMTAAGVDVECHFLLLWPTHTHIRTRTRTHTYTHIYIYIYIYYVPNFLKVHENNFKLYQQNY